MNLTESVTGLLRRKLVSDVVSPAPRDDFLAWGVKLGADAEVLEIGTKRSVEGRSTHLRDMFPYVPRQSYLMADIQEGEDVDIVANLHDLPTDWSGRFDAVIATAVFEHLERPWIAACEVARVLKPGGRCYIATHQTFPLHGYPSDFFRFSRQALALIFADAGLEVLDCAYEHRTWILFPAPLVPSLRKRHWVNAWNRMLPSYIVVHLMARRPETTAGPP